MHKFFRRTSSRVSIASLTVPFQSPMPIDYRDVYSWFSGTIWEKLDCGREHCKRALCCGHETDCGEQPFIYFLPGELGFLKRTLGHRLPMQPVTPDGHLHCAGNAHCVYEMRPVDCRSYPLWPLKVTGEEIAFLDLRGSRCPLVHLPAQFVMRVAAHWERLLSEYPALGEWLTCWNEWLAPAVEEVHPRDVVGPERD